MPAAAVFCASSEDIDERYAVLAGEVGFALARRGWTLVSGGGSVSLVLGDSLTLAKTRRPQLGHADFPSSKRVLQALHSSMQLPSAGRQRC